MPLLGALLLTLRGTLAHANPVNTEQMRTDLRGEGWSGAVDSRVALARGNVDRIDLSFGTAIQLLTMHPEGAGFGGRAPPTGAPPFFRDRWLLLTDGAFIRAESNTLANRGFAHTRYTRMWRPRLGTEAFAQLQYNELTRLRQRAVIGGGARVAVVQRRVVQAWFGSGYMAEYEQNRTEEDDLHPASVVNHRWTSYAVVNVTPTRAQTLVIRNTLYGQPRFDRFADIRVLESFAIEARALPTLALGVDFLVLYDSEPPQGVVTTDLRLGSYLRVRFGG